MTYRIQISTDDQFRTIALEESGLTNSEFTPPSELALGTYYWRVSATDGVGLEGPPSSTFSVTIAPSGKKR